MSPRSTRCIRERRKRSKMNLRWPKMTTTKTIVKLVVAVMTDSTSTTLTSKMEASLGVALPTLHTNSLRKSKSLPKHAKSQSSRKVTSTKSEPSPPRASILARY